MHQDPIIIIDYGMGNLRSVLNKFNRLGCSALVTSDKKVIANAKKLILPGVGHFANGMKNLKEMDLLDVLNKKVLDEKTPILGICLGMQLFTNFSEEGNCSGLGWIDGQTIRFQLKDTKLKVPLMGWNSIKKNKSSALMNNIQEDSLFYFVHSYHVVCSNEKDILNTSEYGYNYTSAIEKGNIFGTQYHPEKSHDVGVKLLENYIEL